jgi:hypothetical protein
MGAHIEEACICIEEGTAMHTIGMDVTERRTLLEALAAESALREMMDFPQMGWSGDTVRRQRSALQGFKVAVPFAMLLWTLIAGMLWVVAR